MADKTLRNFEIMQQVQHLQGKSMAAMQNVLETDQRIEKWAYIIHDKDITEDGSPKAAHCHVMVGLKAPLKISTIAKMFDIPEQYVNKIQSTWGKALAYLTHQNAPQKYQYNEESVVSNFSWQAEVAVNGADALKEITDKIISGEIREFNYTQYIPPDMFLKYERKIKTAFKYRNDAVKQEGVDRNMTCIYIVGGSGTGKTTYAKEYAKKKNLSTFISSGSNDPLDGYAGQDCIILDDLRPSCMGLSDLLKMLDNNTATSVKSRYYNKFLECKLIIITTTLDIENFFKNVFQEEKETCKQLKRRCKVLIEFPPENDKTGDLSIYRYNDKADKYDRLGYQENPLPKLIKAEESEKEKVIEMMSVLGELKAPPPPLTEEEQKALYEKTWPNLRQGLRTKPPLNNRASTQWVLAFILRL